MQAPNLDVNWNRPDRKYWEFQGGDMVSKDEGLYLIGAGGHANALIKMLYAEGVCLSGYVDVNYNKQLSGQLIDRLSEDQFSSIAQKPAVIIGFVGLTCESLNRRYELFARYRDQGHKIPSLLSPFATNVERSFVPNKGIQVLHGAVINYGADIGEGCVINTGAIIEHDVIIGKGCHIAPGAIVLGGAKVGDFSFIGANATVIQGREVPAKSFIKAGSVFK